MTVTFSKIFSLSIPSTHIHDGHILQDLLIIYTIYIHPWRSHSPRSSHYLYHLHTSTVTSPRSSHCHDGHILQDLLINYTIYTHPWRSHSPRSSHCLYHLHTSMTVTFTKIFSLSIPSTHTSITVTFSKIFSLSIRSRYMTVIFSKIFLLSIRSTYINDGHILQDLLIVYTIYIHQWRSHSPRSSHCLYNLHTSMTVTFSKIFLLSIQSTYINDGHILQDLLIVYTIYIHQWRSHSPRSSYCLYHLHTSMTVTFSKIFLLSIRSTYINDGHILQDLLIVYTIYIYQWRSHSPRSSHCLYDLDTSMTATFSKIFSLSIPSTYINDGHILQDLVIVYTIYIHQWRSHSPRFSYCLYDLDTSMTVIFSKIFLLSIRSTYINDGHILQDFLIVYTIYIHQWRLYHLHTSMFLLSHSLRSSHCLYHLHTSMTVTFSNIFLLSIPSTYINDCQIREDLLIVYTIYIHQWLSHSLISSSCLYHLHTSMTVTFSKIFLLSIQSTYINDGHILQDLLIVYTIYIHQWRSHSLISSYCVYHLHTSMTVTFSKIFSLSIRSTYINDGNILQDLLIVYTIYIHQWRSHSPRSSHCLYHLHISMTVTFSKIFSLSIQSTYIHDGHILQDLLIIYTIYTHPWRSHSPRSSHCLYHLHTSMTVTFSKIFSLSIPSTHIHDGHILQDLLIVYTIYIHPWRSHSPRSSQSIRSTYIHDGHILQDLLIVYTIYIHPWRSHSPRSSHCLYDLDTYVHIL